MHDLAGQRLDIALGGVDHGQPLLQLGQAFVRGAGLLAHRLAEPAGHRVEPFGDRLVEFALPGSEHFGDGRHPALHFRLRARDLGHARLRLAGCRGRVRRSSCPRARRTHQRHDQQNDQDQDQSRAGQQRVRDGQRGLAEQKQWLGQERRDRVHLAILVDSRALHKIKTGTLAKMELTLTRPPIT